MIKDVVTIRHGSSVEEAARIMMTEGVTHLPVISEDGRLAGIVTAWDVSKAVALKYTQLEEIMTRDVVTIGLGDPIERAAKKMNENNISALPVIDEEQRVIGMITSDGVSRLGERLQMNDVCSNYEITGDENDHTRQIVCEFQGHPWKRA